MPGNFLRLRGQTDPAHKLTWPKVSGLISILALRSPQKVYIGLFLLPKQRAEGVGHSPKVWPLALRRSGPAAHPLTRGAVAAVLAGGVRGHEVILLGLGLLLEPGTNDFFFNTLSLADNAAN